jgi:hypothetical protein
MQPAQTIVPEHTDTENILLEIALEHRYKAASYRVQDGLAMADRLEEAVNREYPHSMALQPGPNTSEEPHSDDMRGAIQGMIFCFGIYAVIALVVLLWRHL